MHPATLADELHRFYRDIFGSFGAGASEARTAADGLIFADVRGIASHGAANLARVYASRMRDGRIDARATPSLVADSRAVAVLDGCKAIGFVTGKRAMDEAIRRARDFGVGAVAVRGSTHCGSLSFFTDQAVAAGMVGVAMTNLGLQGILRPPGGALPLVGTNVIAVAGPTATRPPFSLDMSTAVVSTGRLRTAMRNGESVPPGWLVDDDGRDVLDPSAYFAGDAHLQFLGGPRSTGGYKGFGLALVADLLCGLLSRGNVGPSSQAIAAGGQADDDGVSHFMLALDVSAFLPLPSFEVALDDMLTALQSAPARPGEEVLYPGLLESRARSELVVLDPELAATLHALAEAQHVSPLQMTNGVRHER